MPRSCVMLPEGRRPDCTTDRGAEFFSVDRG